MYFVNSICIHFSTGTGNLQKNDRILHIVYDQRGVGSKEEHDSDISSITDDEKDDNGIDTSITQTSLKTEPVPVLDGEDVDLDEIVAIGEDDITEIVH